jgi:hypothetical protein
MDEPVINEEELAKFVSEQLKKCKKDAYELQAYLNISYFAGKQWVKVDRTTNRLFEPPAEPWQIRFVANYINPIVRTELAKITKNKFVMYVNPATSDDSDIQSARVAEKVVEWLEYELSLQEKDRENCLWALCTGVSFMKPYWNPNKGRELTDEQGKKVANEGDVDICIVPLFELKFDTSCSKWDEITWVCHEKVRDIGYIKETYGVEVKEESGIAETNLYEAKLLSLSNAGVSYQKREHAAIVHEYWELPSSAYPNGRRITTCGKKTRRDLLVTQDAW